MERWIKNIQDDCFMKINNLFKSHIFRKYKRQVMTNYPNYNNYEINLLKSFNSISSEDDAIIKKFEKKIADYTNSKFAKNYSKGRVGLYHILKSLNFKKGSYIIVPSYTCVVVIEAIIHADLKPLYVDIDKDNLNVDLKKIKKSQLKNVKAIISQHLYGIPQDIRPYKEFAQDNDLILIEDNAQSLGTKIYNKPIGNLGDFSFYSFDFSKPITIGQGGIVTTNNKDYFNKLESATIIKPPPKEYLKPILRMLFYFSNLTHPENYRYGSLWLYSSKKISDLFNLNLFHHSIGKDDLKHLPDYYSYSLSSIQARLGLSLLDRFDLLNKKRLSIAKKYTSALSKNYNFFEIKSYMKPIYLKYPLFVSKRDKVVQQMKMNQIEVYTWFDSPIYPVYQNLSKYYYDTSKYPVAGSMAKQIINLPTNPIMNSQDIERVINVVSGVK